MSVAKPSLVLAVASTAALSSCVYYDDDDWGPPPPPIHYEVEPNDNACCPDPIGVVGVGDALLIRGHIDDVGFDLFDGFAFQSAEPLDLEFTLSPRYGEYADLDLYVFDPYLGQYVLAFDSASSVEKGSFTVPAWGTDFHLVVTSFFGSANYGLEIAVWPPTYGALSTAAGDIPAAKPGREVPVERYFEPMVEAGLDDSPHRVGFALEIDAQTGDVRRYVIEAREGGLAARPAGR
jgi:hypothetical protein